MSLPKKKIQLQIYRIKIGKSIKLLYPWISDVRAEINNATCSKIPDLTENKVSNNNNDLLEKQINFLKEECQNKNPIINILLERRFLTTTSKSLNTGNPEKSAKTVPNNCCEYPKKPPKTCSCWSCRLTNTDGRYEI